MGTVVFIFYFLDEDYTVQTLALLVALAAACWMAGRTPLTASSRRRVLAWSGGGFVAAASALLIFVVAPWMVSLVIRELPWQPYSRVVLEENLQQGRTVLVDFTADW
jgi:thiol:disulfide interchange protein